MTSKDFSGLRERWVAMKPVLRASLAGSLLAIIAAGAGFCFWLLAPNYQVLFSDLEPEDAAAIVAELDKMKIPHRLEEGGKSVLVENDEVHKTRLKLMSKGVNLRGAVGFELFADNDFGMTEFAQKINYQRALQGELARTITSLEEVRSARVHLVLPEAGLFRRNEGRGKASVTIALKPGRRLQPAQVTGIQRLVAAAVPQVDASAVTLLDSRGVALNPTEDGSGAGLVGGDARLELKRQTESYFIQKAAAVLDKAVGAGRAIVTVDVVLNHDAVKVTEEQVLASPGGREGPREAALLRSRQSSQKESRPRAPPNGADANAGSQQNESSSSEYEYQHGKRIEQIVSAPGALRRISVAVVLPELMAPAQMQKLSDVVSMAVGLVPARGDGIALYGMDQLASGAVTLDRKHQPAPLLMDDPAQARPEAAAAGSRAAATSDAVAGVAKPGTAGKPQDLLPWALAALILSCLPLLGWALLRHRHHGRQRLSQHERALMLRELNEWLAPQASKGTRP